MSSTESEGPAINRSRSDWAEAGLGIGEGMVAVVGELSRVVERAREERQRLP